MHRALRLFTIVAALTLANSGCGTRPAALHSVSGKVLVNGKPAQRAKVFFTPLFQPRSGSVLPHAVTEADGSFQLSTYRSNDGAPEGEYSVTIVWPAYEWKGDEDAEGADRLQGRYGNVKEPFTKIVVAKGGNSLPEFNLSMP